MTEPMIEVKTKDGLTIVKCSIWNLLLSNWFLRGTTIADSAYPLQLFVYNEKRSEIKFDDDDDDKENSNE